jgi:hypothetical protein
MNTSISDMRSRLWSHLRSLAGANRHTDLSPTDYIQARYVALVERCEFSGAHRHADLSDLDEYGDVRILDDVAAWLTTGDEDAKARGWQRVCDALTKSANVTIDNRLRELRSLRMSGARTSYPPCVPMSQPVPTEHDDEYQAEKLADRESLNALMRDIADEARA